MQAVGDQRERVGVGADAELDQREAEVERGPDRKGDAEARGRAVVMAMVPVMMAVAMLVTMCMTMVMVMIVVMVMGHLSCRRRRGDYNPDTDTERGPRRSLSTDEPRERGDPALPPT